MAESESSNPRKVMKRASTVQQINQFMQEHAIGSEDDLDIVTFIFAAQAIRPGADQEELMKIFSEADEDDEVDTATKMHNLLKQVSVGDSGSRSSGLGDAVIFAHNVPMSPPSDSEDDTALVRRSSGRRRSVYEQAEIDATEHMARTAQKLDIAAEMIHLGHTADIVASVTGLEMDSINAIVNAVQYSPRKAQTMSADQMSELIRLCNEGPDAVQKESKLAHELLVAMKDQVLNMANAGSGPMISFDSTMSSVNTNDKEEPSVLPSIGEDERLPEELNSEPKAPVEGTPMVYKKEFKEKPLGMSWNQTSDGKNLYVQDVLEGGLAQKLGVLVGSVINSFGNEEVYSLGPEKIYEKFKKCKLPITIGFRRPVATSATDPNVIMLKEVTGLETETVIKLLHKFGGNVQAANEAFYIAKARTRQWISKQKDQQTNEGGEPERAAGKRKKKKRNWWKKWTKAAEKR